jgi:hypothetical protein
LEALEDLGMKHYENTGEVLYKETCTAIKAALEAKDEPWSPVSIGVDVTSKGAHVIGIYALDADTSQIFYAKYHHAPQRTWVGLTDEEIDKAWRSVDYTVPWDQHRIDIAQAIEAKLKEKNA